MGLRDRVLQRTANAALVQPRPSLANGTRRQASAINDGFRELKLRVHNRLLETIDISKLESLDPNLVSTKLTSTIGDMLHEEGRLLTDADRARMIEEIKNEMLGLGPLEPLLQDDEITDILINGHSQVYVER